MATHAPTASASLLSRLTLRQGDRLLGLIVAACALALIAGVWTWSRYGTAARTERPKPAWLGINRVMAQMTDGRMLKLRVDLNLPDESAVNDLSDHREALHALVQEVSSEMNHDDLQGPNGMKHLGQQIQQSVNSYLDQQRISHRVQGVMFEEWTLLPG